MGVCDLNTECVGTSLTLLLDVCGSRGHKQEGFILALTKGFSDWLFCHDKLSEGALRQPKDARKHHRSLILSLFFWAREKLNSCWTRGQSSPNTLTGDEESKKKKFWVRLRCFSLTNDNFWFASLQSRLCNSFHFNNEGWGRTVLSWHKLSSGRKVQLGLLV